jgi:hypothetical protein
MEKRIMIVEETDTEIIEYYEQVAKEDFPEKKTCKWQKYGNYYLFHGSSITEQTFISIKYPATQNDVKLKCMVCGEIVEVVK